MAAGLPVLGIVQQIRLAMGLVWMGAATFHGALLNQKKASENRNVFKGF
jgi:hypothetical protein